MQSECDAYCLTLPDAREASITVDGESVPGKCRFHMAIVRGQQRYTQSAHVPMRMVEVMPERDMAAFVRELAGGAFDFDKHAPWDENYDAEEERRMRHAGWLV